MAGTGTAAAPEDVTNGTEEDKPTRIFQKMGIFSLQDTPVPPNNNSLRLSF